MLTYCEIKPACNQIEIHPYYRSSDLSKFCLKNNIAVVAYSPLSAPFRMCDGGTKNVLEDSTIKSIAESHGKSPAQIVIAWNLSFGHVVIPKSSNLLRAKENFESKEVVLIQDEIDKISKLNLDYKIWDPLHWETENIINKFSILNSLRS